MQSFIAQTFVISSPQAVKVIPIFLAHGSWNPWRSVGALAEFTAAQLHKQFALFVETKDGKQAIVPLALVVSNEAKRNAGTLKELPRTVSWFDEDWQDVESPIRRLPFLLICDGHANRSRKQDAQLIECPFIYTGLDAVDQSRWESITPRICQIFRLGRHSRVPLAGSFRSLRRSPAEIKAPVPLLTTDIESIKYEDLEDHDDKNSNKTHNGIRD